MAKRAILWSETGPMSIEAKVIGVNEAPITFTLPGKPEDYPGISRQLALHGAKQLIGDAAAGKDTAAEKYAAMRQKADALARGEFRSVAGGAILEALVRIGKAKDLSDAAEKWGQLTEEQRKGVRKHPQVRKALAELEAERLAKAAEGSADELPF